MRWTAINEVLRLRSFFNDIAPTFAFEDIGYRFQHLLSELAALDVLMPKRDAKAQDCGGGVVDVFIELLGPQPHSCPIVRILR